MPEASGGPRNRAAGGTEGGGTGGKAAYDPGAPIPRPSPPLNSDAAWQAAAAGERERAARAVLPVLLAARSALTASNAALVL